MHQVTSLPGRHHRLADIPYDLCLDKVGKIAVTNTIAACRVGGLLVVVREGIEHECSYEFVGRMTSCIAMESDAHVHRDIQSWTFWISLATTSQVVHPTATATEVVGIVVFAARVVIDAIRYTCVLEPIACTFDIAWVTASGSQCLHLFVAGRVGYDFLRVGIFLSIEIVVTNLWVGIACYASPSATELDSICSGDMFALVGKSDVVAIHIRTKIECAEVYPCATAHLLVDMISSAYALMHNGIFGLWIALWQGFVADIDRILTTFR